MTKIYLAGGCFWGLEDLLSELDAVVETRVRYIGGSLESPSYADICTGSTGHAETVEVVFDESQMGMGELLDWFFRMHDPTTLNQQGNDRGSQYRSAIFVEEAAHEDEAKAAIERAAASGRWSRPIVTEVQKGGAFYPAEEEHQKYLKKNPHGYSCHFIRD